MAEINKCAECYFAEWERTATGRLSPTGRGHCRWSKRVALPVSMTDADAAEAKRLLSAMRRTIWRKDAVPSCPTFVRLEGHP